MGAGVPHAKGVGVGDGETVGDGDTLPVGDGETVGVGDRVGVGEAVVVGVGKKGRLPSPAEELHPARLITKNAERKRSTRDMTVFRFFMATPKKLFMIPAVPFLKSAEIPS
jgi:hypothetical protein